MTGLFLASLSHAAGEFTGNAITLGDILASDAAVPAADAGRALAGSAAVLTPEAWLRTANPQQEQLMHALAVLKAINYLDTTNPGARGAVDDVSFGFIYFYRSLTTDAAKALIGRTDQLSTGRTLDPIEKQLVDLGKKICAQAKTTSEANAILDDPAQRGLSFKPYELTVEKRPQAKAYFQLVVEAWLGLSKDTLGDAAANLPACQALQRVASGSAAAQDLDELLHLTSGK